MVTANTASLVLALIITSLSLVGFLCWSLGAVYQALAAHYINKASDWSDFRCWAYGRAYDPIPAEDSSLELGNAKVLAWFRS